MSMTIHEITYQQLTDHVVSALCHGRQKILPWGATEATAYLVARLRVLGLETVIAGIVDHCSRPEGAKFWGWRVLAPRSTGQLVFDSIFIGFDRERKMP